MLGAHMSIAGGFDKAVLRGKKAGCDVIQIFSKNNNQWRSRALEKKKIEIFLNTQKQTNVRCVAVHVSYLINCASPLAALSEKSRDALCEEYARANMLGVPYIVMHPGSHMGSGRKKGISAIANSINYVLRDKKGESKILLETTAGQGTSIGSRFEDLAEIMEKVKDNYRIGVCFDTCHVFAAGYDMTNKKAYRATMREFDTIVGVKKIKLFHYNDSKKECGARVDRHAHIAEGCIGIEGFECLINDKRFYSIPKILETPKGEDLKEDIVNLKRLRSLIKTK